MLKDDHHDEIARIPDALPVMVLSGATLFPHGYMPLFIFEQRYRDMLSYVLEHQRMFCIGNAFPDIDPDESQNPVHTLTTAGLVRACVTHPDGTSHLMLSGLQRVEILGWEQDGPFRIASVVPQPSIVHNEEKVASASLEVVDLCSRLCGQDQPMSNQLQEHLRGVKDPAAISDVVAHNFVSEAVDRQQLIETFDVFERLTFLAQHLARQLTNGSG